jgi:D-alanyl-D-alanine carboxypeptidase
MTASIGKPETDATRTGFMRAAAAAAVALCGLLLAPPLAQAQVGSDRYSSIVVDARTGQVLEAENPDAERHPASLTKMMTLYMAFEALRDRRISLGDQMQVSAHAASMEPSKLGLPAGSILTVEQAILGLVTLSANDAASVLGEYLGGDEDRFAQMMTLRAHAMGMAHTTFRNASGLPEPDSHRFSERLQLLQHAELRLPPARHPQSRHHAADLSRSGRVQDGLYQGIRP